MAIQKLEIHGYRSFDKTVWEPGKLNLLVGPNGSGKSNLLQLLELISDTAAGKLFEHISEAGGMVPQLWNQEADSLGWDLWMDPVREPCEFSEIPITFSLDMKKSRGSGYVLVEDLLWTPSAPGGGRRRKRFWHARGRFGIWGRARDLPAQDELGRKLASDEMNTNESLLAQVPKSQDAPLSSQIKETLQAWAVYDEVDVRRGSAIRLPAITQPATRLAVDGSNFPVVFHTLYSSNSGFKQEIDDGMRAAFGQEFVEVKIQLAAAQRIQLAVQWRSSKQPHAGQELSDGTLRFLFLLTILADPEPPPLIAIDEPEVGLHPSMLPIIAEYAAEAAERTQVVISSHSPEFLDAFTEQEPQVTLCQWEEGRTQLLPLPPDQLRTWLEKYRLGEMFISGDLDVLAGPDVDVPDDIEQRMRDLPPEGVPLEPGPTDPQQAPHE